MVRGALTALGLTILTTLAVVVINRTIELQARIESNARALTSVNLVQDSVIAIPLNENHVRIFREAIQIPTVSYQDDFSIDYSQFARLLALIKSEYPHVHSRNDSRVYHEIVNQYSVLYLLRGRDPSLKPVLFYAHYDVVPVTDQPWSVPPFNATMKADYIYGRGTIDMKHCVFGILNALEYLLSDDTFRPNRTILIAFGHDEERGDGKSAKKIAKRLIELGYTSLEFLLDEGSMVLDALFPGLSQPLAVISTSEKGSVNANISIRLPASFAGHSSMPKPEVRKSAVGLLSTAAIQLINHPQPIEFKSATPVLENLVQILPWYGKVIVANVWLFRPLITKIIERSALANALFRTTTAITQINSGTKPNVLPNEGWLLINHRIHPSQTVDDVLQYDREIINYVDPDIIVEEAPGNTMEPTPVSNFDFWGFQVVRSIVGRLYSNAIIVPALFVANTDSRHFVNLTTQICRFSPVRMNASDLVRFHGADERISLKSFENVINFYYHLFLNMDGLEWSFKKGRHSEL